MCLYANLRLIGEYYAANQILQKKLHQGDQDALDFTLGLMSRLEQYKSAHENDDVLADNTVGKIYVEEFAQETFNRGEKVLRASRVTR
jgi:vacuolar protein sorting-associated protein VTA1